ncbi:thiamine pyrophosphate-binding protein [Fodinicola acaciae]|uniref:thiamine pyrophosphate-binding protein n=1 Tax=Fodinicola acaciae TaxID=2681555 RepID=UPI0013D7CCB3|nr:thiamine pyrophosphate-binding protein [Fodinicola acaciae]
MTPIEALFQILREEGVDRIFGNPGTTELPLIDALAGNPDFEYLLALQELSAVSMADGYARATRRPSFVNLHVAAGVANGLIGLLNASRSRTPMVVTAGQQDRRHRLQDPMLSGDLVGLASAAVKHAYEVQHAYDLPTALRRAFALATQPPTGPVFLSIPMDLLAEQTSVQVPGRSTVAPFAAAEVADATEILKNARNPVIVAGDGVGRDDAVDELVAVAEALDAHVYHQPMNDGVNFPGNHPLFAGPLTPTNAAIRAALSPYDVVLIVGCHAFMPHHYTPGSPIPDGATVVQLDTDAAEIGRNFAVRAGLVGGLAPSLAAIAELLPSSQPKPHKAQAAIEVAKADAPIDPLTAVRAIVAALPKDVVVVEEAITAGVHLRQVLRQDRPRSYVHTIGGGLGWGVGAAIGTKLGAPDRPVVAVLGDGCTMFGLQGLWSAARYAVPVTFVVINNGEYRTLKETLDRDKSRSTQLGEYTGLTLGGLDWTTAAAFFGIPSVRVADTDELRAAIRRDGPLLVDVPVTSHRRQ